MVYGSCEAKIRSNEVHNRSLRPSLPPGSLAGGNGASTDENVGGRDFHVLTTEQFLTWQCTQEPLNSDHLLDKNGPYKCASV